MCSSSFFFPLNLSYNHLSLPVCVVWFVRRESSLFCWEKVGPTRHTINGLDSVPSIIDCNFLGEEFPKDLLWLSMGGLSVQSCHHRTAECKSFWKIATNLFPCHNRLVYHFSLSLLLYEQVASPLPEYSSSVFNLNGKLSLSKLALNSSKLFQLQTLKKCNPAWNFAWIVLATLIWLHRHIEQFSQKVKLFHWSAHRFPGFSEINGNCRGSRAATLYKLPQSRGRLKWQTWSEIHSIVIAFSLINFTKKAIFFDSKA